jgi:hypothetical protein
MVEVDADVIEQANINFLEMIYQPVLFFFDFSSVPTGDIRNEDLIL